MIANVATLDAITDAMDTRTRRSVATSSRAWSIYQPKLRVVLANSAMHPVCLRVLLLTRALMRRRYAGSRALICARARAAVEVSGGVRRRYVARLNMPHALMGRLSRGVRGVPASKARWRPEAPP